MVGKNKEASSHVLLFKTITVGRGLKEKLDNLEVHPQISKNAISLF